MQRKPEGTIKNVVLCLTVMFMLVFLRPAGLKTMRIFFIGNNRMQNDEQFFLNVSEVAQVQRTRKMRRVSC
jgi:hypothetical protein